MLFAADTDPVPWIVALGAVLAGGTKFILDLVKARADGKAVDHDKTVAGLERIIELTREDYERMEEKVNDHEKRLVYESKRRQRCEKERIRDQAHISHLYNELRRNKIDILPYRPDESDIHAPLNSDIDSDQLDDEESDGMTNA